MLPFPTRRYVTQLICGERRRLSTLLQSTAGAHAFHARPYSPLFQSLLLQEQYFCQVCRINQDPRWWRRLLLPVCGGGGGPTDRPKTKPLLSPFPPPSRRRRATLSVPLSSFRAGAGGGGGGCAKIFTTADRQAREKTGEKRESTRTRTRMWRNRKSSPSSCVGST